MRRRLVFESLEDRRLLSVAPAATTAGVVPSDYEQYMLELINLARSDPAAEASRDVVTLDEGLPAGTISADAKQPLAFNPCLITSAESHSKWMLDTDTFSYAGSGGSSPGDRMAAAGYTFSGPWGWGENIAWRGSTVVPDVRTTVAQIEKNLFVDSTVEGRGHRIDLMNPSFREVGVGICSGDFSIYKAVMVTQDFAYTGGNAFLTGVVFNDSLVQENSFYTPGEGIGGVTITATRQIDQIVFTTTTWSSGGYSLAVPEGTYTVTASGAGLGRTYSHQQVTIGEQNVKVDFAMSEVLPSLSIANVSLPEGNNGANAAAFAVTLSGMHDEPVTVRFATTDGTATTNSDYQATSGTLTWQPGDAPTQTINVMITGDTVAEFDETFFANLSDATGARLARSQATGTILNDDFLSSGAVGEKVAPKNGQLESNDKLVMTWIASNVEQIVSQRVTVDGKAMTSVGGPYGGRYYTCSIGAWPVGGHTYAINATNMQGVISTITGTFTVVAPILPSIVSIVAAEFSAPKNGKLESGERLRITWAASSSNGIASQSVTVDGRVAGTIAGPFKGLYYSCTIGAYAAGNHTYRIKSTDSKGDSSAVTGSFVVVNPPPPTICGVAIGEAVVPKNGRLEAREKLRITWIATSPRGIASHTVTVDGRTIGSIGGPYGGLYYSCAIGVYSAGQHAYVIKATDSKGLRSTTSGTFTVAAASASSTSRMAARRAQLLAAVMLDLDAIDSDGTSMESWVAALPASHIRRNVSDGRD